MTKISVAVDPGIHGTGIAVAFDGVLRTAHVSTALDLPAACKAVGSFVSYIGHVTEAVIEIPQIYPAARQEGDPNDLISVAAVAGAAASALYHAGANVMFVRPAAWKGQAPKEVIHARTRAVLSSEELAIVDRAKRPRARKVDHNALDAVSILVWHLGRLAK